MYFLLLCAFILGIFDYSYSMQPREDLAPLYALLRNDHITLPFFQGAHTRMPVISGYAMVLFENWNSRGLFQSGNFYCSYTLCLNNANKSIVWRQNNHDVTKDLLLKHRFNEIMRGSNQQPLESPCNRTEILEYYTTNQARDGVFIINLHNSDHRVRHEDRGK